MKPLKKFINEILYPACLTFSVIVFAFSMFSEIAGLNNKFSYNLSDLILFMIFSLIFSWSLKVFRTKKLSFPKALALNFLCYIADTFVVFAILGGKKNFAGMFIVFTLYYILFAIVFAVARRLTNDADSPKKSEYKKMFK